MNDGLLVLSFNCVRNWSLVSGLYCRGAVLAASSLTETDKWEKPDEVNISPRPGQAYVGEKVHTACQTSAVSWAAAVATAEEGGCFGSRTVASLLGGGNVGNKSQGWRLQLLSHVSSHICLALLGCLHPASLPLPHTVGVVLSREVPFQAQSMGVQFISFGFRTGSV